MESHKKTAIGMIPTDWKLKKLGDISEFSNGKGHEQFIDEEGEYIVVNSKFISTDGRVIKYSIYNLTPLNVGDITMVMSDIPNGKAIAKCFLIEEDNKYTLNQRICSIKADQNCDTKFLYYVLNRNRYYLAFDNGVSQTNLRINEVLDCPIQLPPLPEQQKIADILSTVDAKIDIIDQQIKETQELKKGLMQRLLTKGIGHTEFKDSPLGRIPKSWEVVRLNQVGDIVTGTTPKTSVREYYTENGVLWASPADLGKQKYIESTNKQLTNLGFQQTRKLPPKSIMVTCIGSTIGKIGMTNSNMSTNQQINSIVCNESNCPEFYYYLIEKIAVYIKSLAGTQAVPLLNKTDFSAINVVNPPMQEQKIISEILKTLDEKTEILSEKKETYQVLKQGLMQQLLTGKIRVKV